MKHAIEILEAARDDLVSDEMTNRDAGFIDAADECFHKAEEVRRAIEYLDGFVIGGGDHLKKLLDDVLGTPDPFDTDLDDPLPPRTCGDGETCDSCQ